MEKSKLTEIEEHIFGCFRTRRTARLLSRELFESTSAYANSDLVRALEDLEKKWRLLIRYTDEGNDWAQLTPEGAKLLGISESPDGMPSAAKPHPPKSST
jgi:hypothetical protein